MLLCRETSVKILHCKDREREKKKERKKKKRKKNLQRRMSVNHQMPRYGSKKKKKKGWTLLTGQSTRHYSRSARGTVRYNNIYICTSVIGRIIPVIVLPASADNSGQPVTFTYLPRAEKVKKRSVLTLISLNERPLLYPSTQVLTHYHHHPHNPPPTTTTTTTTTTPLPANIGNHFMWQQLLADSVGGVSLFFFSLLFSPSFSFLLFFFSLLNTCS